MSRERLVIVDGVRTPFTKMGTSLARLNASELGRVAVNALLTKTGIDPGTIDEVIFGCVGQPIDSANVARVIALRAGVPRSVPAVTVSRNCASGCEAITQADQKLAAGCGELFVVGGVESMSQYPLLYRPSAAAKFNRLARAKSLGQKIGAALGFRPGDFSPLIGLKLGLSDPVCGLNMGQTAELIGRENGATRELQDAFALASHQKAAAAAARLADEICPVYLPPKYKSAVTADNGPRAKQSIEALAKLRPVFERGTGTVTAGNASQVSDGAVALLVAGETRAAQLSLEPLGTLAGYAYAGCEPSRMGLGPVYAMNKLEQLSGLGLNDADIIEINEAFAAQVLAVRACAESATFARDELKRDRPLGQVPEAKLNVNGGSIALGHPVGATGARLALTSLLELRRRKAKRALISLCIGGGQGAAMWMER
ncbi:MAG: thiolase family protein [Verrucomicrobia bacterium]|nr:thiolase family protein [Verrucomicrobiota bacterium]